MCQLPIGVLLDKFGIKRVGRVSTFLWSIASSVPQSLPASVGSSRRVSCWESAKRPRSRPMQRRSAIGSPPKERSFATSLFDGAAKFSSAIGVPLIGILLIKVGWRWSFAATGLISFLYFLLFWQIYRDPVDDPKLTEVERDYIVRDGEPVGIEEEQQASLGYLLRQRKVLGMVLGFGSYNYVFYLLLTWLPSYLSAVFHIDLLHSFLYTGLPWLFATVTDLLIGGWLVDASFDADGALIASARSFSSEAPPLALASWARQIRTVQHTLSSGSASPSAAYRLRHQSDGPFPRLSRLEAASAKSAESSTSLTRSQESPPRSSLAIFSQRHASCLGLRCCGHLPAHRHRRLPLPARPNRTNANARALEHHCF